MKIKPIFDRVLLKPITKNNEHGILLPDSETQSQLMEVVEIGTKQERFEVEKGDKVLINTFAGSTWTFDKQIFVLIKETDILAIYKEEE